MKIEKYLAIILICLLMSINIIPITGHVSTQSNYDGEANFIELSVTTPLLKTEVISIEGQNYASLELENEGFTNIEGQAKLPVIRRFVEIPQNAIPEITILADSWETTSLGRLGLPNQIQPVTPSETKISIHSNKLSNIDFDKIIKDKKIEKVKIAETGEIRGHRYAVVEISPIIFYPNTGLLKIMKSCDLRISFTDSDFLLTSQKNQRYSSEAFNELFSTLFTNYIDNNYGRGISALDTEGYLIIVYDDFYDEILPLSTWKESLGYDVTVTKTSEIPGGTAKEDIADYIETAYNTWPIPPTYVLLVGDTAQIPTFTGDDSNTATDLYYVTINTGDYFPDVFIGRFPASQESHVTAMVDKTIFYETGDFTSNDWLTNATFIAGVDNYYISEGTHNYVIDTYLEPNGWTCDKLYETTYGATTQDVKDSISAGKNIVVFSGHGSSTSWADGPPFSQSDVNGLTNLDMYPFVCSHACVTGKFNIDECFGETWLRAEDKAGLVFWGSSANTMWDEDDVLEKKMFDSWWVANIETIGGMTDMALYYLYQHYGGGGSSQYYFECYNILGDPSIKIWVDDPITPPEITNVNAHPNPVEIGGSVQISCDVTAIAGIIDVRVDITYPDNSVVNQTMTSIPLTDSYYYDATYAMPGMYQYFIWAKDANGDFSVSATYSFTAGIAPVISNVVANPMIQVPGGNVEIACTVVDNVLVDSVSVNISYPDSSESSYLMSQIPSTDNYSYDSLYNDPGMYSYVIFAVDNQGNSVESENYYFYIGTDTAAISLDIGWNLITIPVENNYWASSLTSEIDGCQMISWFDAENQTYKSYIVGGPPSFDFEIRNGYGLFLLTDQESVYFVTGTDITTVSIPLSIGWNMLGWYHEYNTMASSLAENISGTEMISLFNSSSQSFESYIVGGPPQFDFTITPGMGIFVLVDVESVWYGEG